MNPPTKLEGVASCVEPKPLGPGPLPRPSASLAAAMSRPTSDQPEPDLPVRAGPLIVTIDGPAGTGKSSTARALAKRLGVDFLDTGAMYRAAAAIVLDSRTDATDPKAVVERVRRANLQFDWTTDPPTLLSDGKSIMGRLRDPDVTALVSPLAGVTELRRLMVSLQQQIGGEHPRLVTEGRDQGSVVFPRADVKIYLDADAAVRAARRADQLRQSGQSAEEADQQREITARDRSDSTRREGPLTCPPDAVRVDTTHITFDQVVERLDRLVRQTLARRG